MTHIPLNSASRRKLLARIFVFVALAAVIWLQPKVQTWLDGHTPDSLDSVTSHELDPTDVTQHSSNLKRVVIKDVDQPPTAEVDRSDAATPNRNASTAKPAPGKLREIRENVLESIAGLLYVPGSADDHRLSHVMQHAKDDLTKPIHGVFEGDRDQIVAIIDEAFQLAQKGGSDVRSEKQNDRRVYTVNLRKKIGYMGGSEGDRKGNPECRYLRIVLEDENIVISAYPVKSF
jgi:hypothetical protein